MNKILLFICVLILSACNPYRGFSGVKTEEISGKKPPSVKIREGHKKSAKKMQRMYRKEMKRKAKRLGTTKKK